MLFRSWFRGMERRGFHINWIDAMKTTDEKTAMILEICERQNGTGNI